MATTEVGGSAYRESFAAASSDTTSEVTIAYETDLVLDVQSMPEIEDAPFDCVFCSGVLEHVPDDRSGLAEITRILKKGGILLLGLSFRQPIHMPPDDYWRFTEYGIRNLLADSYDIVDLTAMDAPVSGFPAAFWVKASKRTRSRRVDQVAGG